MQRDQTIRAGHTPVRFPVHRFRPRAGAGFKPEHLSAILTEPPCAAFFEIHAENHMGKGGTPHAQLDRLRQDYPISVHGVGMSIGGPSPIDPAHLARFKSVVDRWQPALVSEHLAWSTHDGIFYNDLLPPPYTDETLGQICSHIDEVQTAIGRQILLENPSTYVLFEQSTWAETDFIAEIARRSGCGLLLDVNNVFVSATNHGFSPQAYIDSFPVGKVREIHLAGHAAEEDTFGRPLLIDSHDRPVDNAVWRLFQELVAQTGPLPTLIEWDNDIPQWPVLVSEMDRANAILDAVDAALMLGRRHAG